MADPNLITMRSDKNSFLLFEEMDSNLLQLKELITEFNVFVDNIFQNHVADFASFTYDYEQYKTTIKKDLLRYAKKNEANTFTNSNEFIGTVALTGETIANDLTMVSGEINNAPIGQSKPSTAHFTHLAATDSVLFNAARSLRLPIWTTATRPDAEASMIGFNTDTGEFEGYNGDEWTSVSGINTETLETILNQNVLGMGQTWQDLTVERLPETTYTNTTGRPIMVSLNIAPGYYVELLVDDQQVSRITTVAYEGIANTTGSINAIVPDGSTYYVEGSIQSILSWVELR